MSNPKTILGISADVLYAEMNRLYAEHHVLRPQDLVDAARPVDSPLHEMFEWDDGIAAEKFRVAQARTGIRMLRIEYKVGSGIQSVTPYVHVPQSGDETQQYYHPIRVVIEDRKMYKSVVESFIHRIIQQENALAEIMLCAEERPDRVTKIRHVRKMLKNLREAAEALQE